MENTHRFSGNQQVSDITMLLWKLGSLCIDEMETLLYGTDHKHGTLFKQASVHMSKQELEQWREERDGLLELMMDVVQELGMTEEEVSIAWEQAEEARKEGHAWGKEWVEKYGE